MALLDQCVGYWRLEEASGPRADSAGANTLTDNNTVTQGVGKVGFAGQFTAANAEYLSIADNAALSMGAGVQFTVAAWVFGNTFSSSSPIVAKFGGPSYEYMMDTAGSPSAVPRIWIGSTGFPHASGFVAGGWHLVIAWYDGATANTQLDNGAVTSTAHIVDAPDGTSEFRIASRGDTAQYWDGRLDEVGVWKRVLTAPERTQLWNGGAGFNPFTGGAALASSTRMAIRIGI